MKQLSIFEIEKATDGRLIRTCDTDHVRGVIHDSRECGPSDMFVCIKGPNRDGHDYLSQVIAEGCKTALISDEKALKDDMDINAILVEDTVEAMGRLAQWYLDSLDIIRIAVTGSVGKTSTRDMIYYTLNESYNCGRNLKNYNNEIGLPLSIFTLDESHDAVVLEMGMSDFGEIRKLSKIVKPHVGVITGIGTAHMEHLGSREGIFEAKMELTENVESKEKGGTMIFAMDDEFLTRDRTGGDYESIFVGEDGRSDFIVSDVTDKGIEGVEFALEADEKIEKYTVPVPGRHNGMNAALAIAVGTRLGMSPEEMRRGLARVQLTGHRLRVVRSGALTVIDDTYNASPDSMKGGLKVLEMSSCSGKKIAILGEMYELGEREEQMHFSVGAFAAGCGIDKVIGVGPLAQNITEGARTGGVETQWFATKEELIEELKGGGILAPSDMVLVKASRGMKLEEVVEAITKKKYSGILDR